MRKVTVEVAALEDAGSLLGGSSVNIEESEVSSLSCGSRAAADSSWSRDATWTSARVS